MASVLSADKARRAIIVVREEYGWSCNRHLAALHELIAYQERLNGAG